MSKTNRKEPAPVWSFFCEAGDGTQGAGSKEEAIENILGSKNKYVFIHQTDALVQKRLAHGITGTQLRKLFNTSKKEDFDQLRIQLIYLIARQNNLIARDFAHFVKELAVKVNDDTNRLNRFHLFLESVVSYHKYYSTK